jgi:polar amino acid transport system substrate-binding protein
VTPARQSADAPITVAWRDKPPYHYTADGRERGFLLARAQQVFAAAGVENRFVTEPAKRIWANFHGGKPNYCSIGWYRLPERERVAQYSAPFHLDLPHTVLVAPGAQARGHATLASLLGDMRLSIGVVDGVSYGPEIDALIARGANQVVRRTVEPTAMMRMLGVGRASFMLLDQEDWEYYRRRDASLRNTVRRDFPDMPAGLTRYIVCSRDVAPDVMARLNRAIDRVGKARPGAGQGARRAPGQR